MGMRIHLLSPVALLALPAAVLAQTMQAPSNAEPSTLSRGFITSNIVVAAVPNRPFTGRETLAWTHLGPNHDDVTSTFEATIARNSLGQVHLDSLTPSASPAIVPDFFTIVDPVARMNTVCYKAPPTCYRGIGSGRFGPNPRSPADLQLGEKLIDGLAVSGTRKMAPSRSGVPDPSTSTSDLWYSSDLNATLEVTYREPNSGTTTAHLAILDRAEPDPALFAPPSTFAVVEPPPPGITPPKILATAVADFSSEAKKKKISGTVVILLVVDASGRPTQLQVLRSVGYGLDQKAIESARKYKFQPAIKDGLPISFPMTIESDFQSFQ